VSAFERISKRARMAARTALLAVVALAALGAGCATASPNAWAGEYHVYSCRTPSGESAPVDGWSGSNSGPETFAQDTCAQPGGALTAALRAETKRTANTDSATWAFAAPSGETLAGATLWRAGDADGGAAADASYEYWFAGPTEPEMFDVCSYLAYCFEGEGETSQPFSPTNEVIAPSGSLGSHLYVTASCGGVAEYSCPTNPGDPNGYAAVVYVYAADLVLEQTVGPMASNVSGNWRAHRR
jgi:hypothetical protein